MGGVVPAGSDLESQGPQQCLSRRGQGTGMPALTSHIADIHLVVSCGSMPPTETSVSQALLLLLPSQRIPASPPQKGAIVMNVCHSSPHSLAAPSYGKKNDSSDWRMERVHPSMGHTYQSSMDYILNHEDLCPSLPPLLSPLKIFIFSIQVSPLSLHPASSRQN